MSEQPQLKTTHNSDFIITKNMAYDKYHYQSTTLKKKNQSHKNIQFKQLHLSTQKFINSNTIKNQVKFAHLLKNKKTKNLKNSTNKQYQFKKNQVTNINCNNKELRYNESSQYQDYIGSMNLLLPIVKLNTNSLSDVDNNLFSSNNFNYSQHIPNFNKTVSSKFQSEGAKLIDKNAFKVLALMSKSPIKCQSSCLDITRNFEEKNQKTANSKDNSKDNNKDNSKDNNKDNIKDNNKDKISNFDADLIIKQHKANNIKVIQRKLRSTMSKISDHSKVGCSKNQHKKYKDKNDDNDILTNPVMSVREYNRKCGYQQNSLIFVFNSQDSYIKQILLSWGWIQNPSIQSPFYNLKWTYSPCFNDFNRSIKQMNQDNEIKTNSIYYNHFCNSHQMTSKLNLTNNLKNNQCIIGKINNFFPKTYDVANPSQCAEFQQEFKKVIMYSILTKYYQYLYSSKSQFVSYWTQHYKTKYAKQQNSKRKDYFSNSKTLIFLKTTFKALYLQNIRSRNPNILTHSNLTLLYLRYWRKLRKISQSTKILDSNKVYHHFLDFNQSQFAKSWQIIKQAENFSHHFKPDEAKKNFIKEYYSTPSDIAIRQIVKQYIYCLTKTSKVYLQKDNILKSFGDKNIWIIKPSGNARGSGIKLQNSQTQIVDNMKGIQSRIVQKYIEKPLLIKNAKYPNLYNRKFDIRQWVMVRSLDPLQVYMFSQCYLRICSEQYNIEKINGQHLQKHLTNYSVNKQKFKESQNVCQSVKLQVNQVINSTDFGKILLSEYGISWEDSIKPQIKSIALKTVRACQENLYDVHSIQGATCFSCFQLYGYDILIDQNFKCWLLEVNLSPACEQRTIWLTQMLKAMGEGLLKIVLSPHLIKTNINGHSKYKWQLVEKQNYQFPRQFHTDKILQINGSAINLQYPLKMTEKLIRNQAAKTIQTYFRKYQKIKQNKKEKNTLNASKIKSYLFGFLYSLKEISLFQKQQIKTIKFYLKSSIQNKNYINQQQRYYQQKTIKNYLNTYYQLKSYNQKKIMRFLSDIKSSILAKQLIIFNKYFLNANKNINTIKHYFRVKLQLKKSKKNIINNFLKSRLIINLYENYRRPNYISAKRIGELQKYLIGFSNIRKYENKVEFNNCIHIEKYLKGALQILQCKKKKCLQFACIVGRIMRVSIKRVRGDVLKLWIAIRKKELLTEQIKMIQIYFRGFKQIFKYKKEKMIFIDATIKQIRNKNNKDIK